MKVFKIKFALTLLAVTFFHSAAMCQTSAVTIAQSTMQTSPEIEKKINFNLRKLKNRKYTGTYGDGYTWYTAAEELGQIGKPAVPHLIKKLNTKDRYELKLALYALMLATQDSKVITLTNGEYINLPTVLDAGENSRNRKIALQWWEKHQHVF